MYSKCATKKMANGGLISQNRIDEGEDGPTESGADESAVEAGGADSYGAETRARPSTKIAAPAKRAVRAAPNVTPTNQADEVKRETRGQTIPKKTGLFAESREKTAKFDAGVKDAAIRNRESAYELGREARRGSQTKSAAPVSNTDNRSVSERIGSAFGDLGSRVRRYEAENVGKRDSMAKMANGGPVGGVHFKSPTRGNYKK